MTAAKLPSPFRGAFSLSLDVEPNSLRSPEQSAKTPLRRYSDPCAINPYPAHEPCQRRSKAQQMALRFAHDSTRFRLKHYAERAKSALSIGRPFPSAGSHCLHALNTQALNYQIGPISSQGLFYLLSSTFGLCEARCRKGNFGLSEPLSC